MTTVVNLESIMVFERKSIVFQVDSYSNLLKVDLSTDIGPFYTSGFPLTPVIGK